MNEKSIFFLSDVHLPLAFSNCLISEQRKKLIGFFKKVSDEGEQLYLCGDFFDFWFEWRHSIPKYYLDVISCLHQLINAGIEVHFIAGNHDFSFGDTLQNLGIKCHREHFVFVWNNKRFFVSHGDGIAKCDQSYRVYKKIIRSLSMQFLYRTFFPSDLGIGLARLVSEFGKKHRKVYLNEWKRDYLLFAQDHFRNGVDFVVLGHTHFPDIQMDGEKVYINCGDWFKSFSYARAYKDRVFLEKWDT